MTLNDSFFISTAPIPREIELPDGSKHTLYFKELESSVFERFHEQRASDDAAVRYGATAALIAAAVCEPDGTPSMNATRAMSLKPKVKMLLQDTILEVCGFTGKKDSPSVEEPGSDTSSA
jgi:hypothetical protein